MEEIKNYIPNDSSKQMNLLSYLTFLNDKKSKKISGNLLDFGCGVGATYKELTCSFSDINWHGIDVFTPEEADPIVKEKIRFYDGSILPFADKYFDIIISNQVFEHLETPHISISEIERVLKSNGILLGSVSQMEPYHAQSVFNFTPYGLMCLLKNSSLEIVEFRPGIHSLTLIIRALLNKRKYFNKFWAKESPLNKWFSIYGKLTHKSHYSINYYKLYFSGQFCFYIRKKSN